MSVIRASIHVHKNYTDYARKLALFRNDWRQCMKDIQSFVTVTDESVIKEFSFKYLNESLCSSLYANHLNHLVNTIRGKTYRRNLK